jgi:hypothetical protein
MFEPARLIVAATVFVALVLGTSKAARADAPMTQEQAEAAAVAADAADAAQAEDDADDVIDQQTVERVIWSEPDEPPAWFPELNDSAIDLTLSPSPMQTAGYSADAMAAQAAAVIPNEHTVIPLPAAAWTGLAGLASLATIRGRKALIRFFFD